MIQLENIFKRYNDTTVVENLNLQIEAGEIVGIIGHNGAGKSTTLKMIAGLVEPTSGSVRVMGRDIQKDSVKIKQHIGFLPEDRYHLNKSGMSRKLLNPPRNKDKRVN